MAEPYAIKMPQLSDTMTEGVVVTWEKQPGDKISRGDIVATVETDKAVMDVEVFREGYLSGPLAVVDSVVPVGEPIAYLVPTVEEVTGGEVQATPTKAAPQPESTPAPVSSVPASPSAPAAKEAPHPAAPSQASHIIKMPQLSDTMTEGVVVTWEKHPGDKVARGDVVATVETDKAVMDVEVFREGYLSGPITAVDSVVPVGDPIAYLVDSQDAVVAESVQVTAGGNAATAAAKQAPSKTAAATPQSARPAVQARGGSQPAPRPAGKQATPYARNLAAQMGVDLNTLQARGPGGVIDGQTVLQAAQRAPVAAVPGRPQEVDVPGAGRPMTSMEKAVSHNMTASLAMPTFRVTVHARPEALRKAAKQNGVSVTVAIAKACAVAMEKHPSMNWAYQPVDKLVEHESVDIGIAVEAEGGGLVVPVLRGCESRSLQELDQEWRDLVDRARKRRLKPEEYAHPTFMVSNMGMLNVSQFDAIPMPGMAAVLAISTAAERGMPLTVTADHRVVNGAEVAKYLNTLKQTVEQPEQWLGSPGPAIPPGEWDYDVVIIGGGPGGEDCARDLAAHGIKVAMINDSPLPGGECLWRGCIPSKTWRAAADRMRDRAHDARLGVKGTTRTSLNWKALEETRRGVLESRGDMALKTDTGMKVKFIQGFARFDGDHHVVIDTSGNIKDPHRRGTAGDGKKGERLSFGCAVIATGAPPFVPPIKGAQEGLAAGGVLTSDTVWTLDSAPKKIGIIGAGAIGLEMAQIFQDFGSEVVVLEAQDRILAEVDAEIAKSLHEILAADPHLALHTSAKVEAIKGRPGEMEISYATADGKNHRLKCDYVLMATGKRPQVAPLLLDKAGVAVDGPAVKADASCRTSVPHIFAVGDVIGGLMLAHTAGQQGRVAAANILGDSDRYDQDKDCGVIFTRPQAAFAGLTVAQCKAKGVDAAEVKVPMNIDAKAMITGETAGMIKLVADKNTRAILGVHLLTDHADTLIGEAVLMVSCGLTLEQVGRAIHPHPTQTELFGDLARRLLSRLRRSQRAAAKAGTG